MKQTDNKLMMLISIWVFHEKMGPWDYQTVKIHTSQLANKIKNTYLLMIFLIQKHWYFSYFSTKTYVVGTH